MIFVHTGKMAAAVMKMGICVREEVKDCTLRMEMRR